MRQISAPKIGEINRRDAENHKLTRAKPLQKSV